jgi:RecB family endonuclease NucS
MPPELDIPSTPQSSPPPTPPPPPLPSAPPQVDSAAPVVETPPKAHFDHKLFEFVLKWSEYGIKVSFENIQLVTALSLVDTAEFSLYASEEDMQKAILLKPELLEEGFRPISWEKKVEPGFIDVYGTDKNGRLVVVEIKRKTAGKAAVLQLAKYIEAIKGKADREVRGILASPGIGKDVQRLLVTFGLEFKHMDPRKCAEILRRAETRKLAEYFEENTS